MVTGNKYFILIAIAAAGCTLILILGLELTSASSTTTAVICPESWSQFEGHCYYLVRDKHSMSACRTDCQQQREGAELASIHSSAENQFLVSLIQHRPVRGGEKDTWIAGEIKGRNFTWMDGTPWDYENWAAGEPHKGSRPCVFFGKDLDDPGKWYDGVCEWSRWTFDCVCKI